MPSKAATLRLERPALLTLLFCLTILFATPAAAQERPGAFSGSASPPVSASSFTSTPALPEYVGALPDANAGAETPATRDASVGAAAEPAPAKAAPTEPAAATATQSPAQSPSQTQSASMPSTEITEAPPDCARI